jgi:hypothetical protein
MRWSIIRLIWCRELRDQLRDRRTLFMIAVLPVLLYPVAGFGVMQLARGFLSQRAVIGVQGAQYLPGWTPRCTALSPVSASAWLTMTPPAPGAALAGIERVTAAAALYQARQADPPRTTRRCSCATATGSASPSSTWNPPRRRRRSPSRQTTAPPR